jgi:hypothetical protein
MGSVGRTYKKALFGRGQQDVAACGYVSYAPGWEQQEDKGEQKRT